MSKYKELLHNSEYMREGGRNIVILTLLCLLISILIEIIKEKVGIYKLSNYITEKLKS